MIGRTTAINATMQRSGDGATVKHNEDNKSIVNQMNAQQMGKKEQMHKAENVVKKEDAEFNQEKYDAKEKSKNEYFLSGQKKKSKKKNEENDGVVIVKHCGGFDVKI